MMKTKVVTIDKREAPARRWTRLQERRRLRRDRKRVEEVAGAAARSQHALEVAAARRERKPDPRMRRFRKPRPAKQLIPACPSRWRALREAARTRQVAVVVGSYGYAVDLPASVSKRDAKLRAYPARALPERALHRRRKHGR